MILQRAIPYDVLNRRALPGIQPLGDAPWFLVDEVYAEQMAHRSALLETRRRDVVADRDADATLVAAMLEQVLGNLPDGFRREGAACVVGEGLGPDPGSWTR